MKRHNGFLIQKNIIIDVEKLSNDDAGILFKNILKYANGEYTFIPEHLTSLYDSIVESINLEWSKYNPKTKKFHWNYKGGITDENKRIRNSTAYKYWRESVFKRDKYTCQECDKSGGVLNAHHILKFCDHANLRLDINNGITLCFDCHKKEHKK